MRYYLTFVLLFSFFAQAKPSSTQQILLSEEEITRKYSLSELFSALNGLRSVIDGQKWCNVKFDDAKYSMLPLRPIYDKKLKAEKDKKTPVKQLLARQKTCKKSCDCKLLSDLLKNRTDISAEDFTKVEKIERSLSSKELNLCAKRQTKICAGPLLRSLEAISKKDYQAPADF